MAILRKNKKDKYTVIDNTVFFDYSLSFKAKGLLCQMLSLPDGWSFSVEGLSQFSCDGITVVRNALTELENHNYLKRTQLRDGEGKMAGVEYVVSETPMSDEPISENPISDNPTLLNTNKSNTKKSNTNLHTHKEQRPTLEEVEEYISDKKLNVDAKKFYEYFDAGDWLDSKGKPVRNWKQKLITWSNNNGNDFGTSNRERRRVSENVRRTVGGTSESGERVRAKLPPMAAMSNETE